MQVRMRLAGERLEAARRTLPRLHVALNGDLAFWLR
jgi:hypothetical protein